MERKDSSKQGRLPAPDFEKLYYSIGEVAGILDVNPSLIRYWEDEFNIIRPKRNKKGNRLFTREDIDRLKLIHHLLKNKGYTLKGAKEAMKENMGGLLKEQEVIQRLTQIRKQLLDLRSELSADDEPPNQ